MLVAEGAVDVAVDAVGVEPYDLAAVKVIVEEAGGTFTDRDGVATHEHDTAISTNGLLHARGDRGPATDRRVDTRRATTATASRRRRGYGCGGWRRRSRSQSTVSTLT